MSIIDRIDDVIEDWQTSPDAMHWTADPSPRQRRDATGLTVPCYGCADPDPHDGHLAPGLHWNGREWVVRRPQPLRIDGAAYRRRTQARRRRG